MNSKLPAMQFYPGDWRKDPGVQSLDYEHRGIWFEILCLMHESEDRGKLLLNGKAMSEDALARILGLDKQILTNVVTTLLTYGVASIDEESGALMSRRMVRDEKTRRIRAEAGKQGGNPLLLKQKATTQDNHFGTPSSSSSFSTSSSTTKHTSSDDEDGCWQPNVSKVTAKKSAFGEAERSLWFQDKFWPVVWSKTAVGAARKAWLIKITTPELRDRVIAAAIRQGPLIVARSRRSGSSILHPSTWLNQERWADEVSIDDIQGDLVGVYDEAEAIRNAWEQAL